jgi:hypothetical protein
MYATAAVINSQSVLKFGFFRAALCVLGKFFMTIVKRCEQEVKGSWADKQAQAVKWLDHFVPHYRGLCVPGDGCPAKHGASAQEPQHSLRSGDIEKRWLDGKDAQDEAKIIALTELIERMKADVTMFVHGFHTCWVESAHNEKAVFCCKRVEVWVNWKGKCKLVQLFHNKGAAWTAEMVRRRLGWHVTEEVLEEWRKIDRDKTKHREIQAKPEYNRRRREVELEQKARKYEAKAAAEATEREEKRKEKERAKAAKGKEERTTKATTVKHSYSVRKRPLYGNVGETRKEEASRKRRVVADKENASGEENRSAESAAATTRQEVTAEIATQQVDAIMSAWRIAR